MSDLWSETVGPVIEKDFIVTRISEWDRTVALK